MVGVDVGGTFTDAIAIAEDGNLRAAKVASTPADPSAGFEHALCELSAAGAGPSQVRLLGHGTTVATNAPSSITVTLPDGSVLPPKTKFTRRLPPGTIIRVETAGGGGFGDPAGRPGASRAGDLADGLIPMREES